MSMSKGRTLSLASFVLSAALSSFTLARAQEQSPAASQPSSQQAPADPAPSTSPGKKPKKVWTNEDMGAVKDSPISQVGKAAPAPLSGNSSPANTPAVNPQVVATYRKQLAQLQAQEASVEKQIADLKDFQRGEPGHDSGLQLHKRYSSEPIDVQIHKLEDKRKQIADQIDALSDSARKKGILSGQLH